MLQQTQVSRVIPAYERFLGRFPDAAACASSGQADVVRQWEGLGYHRRARALHGASVEIMATHGGVVPSALTDLRSLPGIGDYTARAIKAFAFEHDVGVVDTNTARIISRAVVGAPISASVTQAIADGLVPAGQGWRHNQAMLDFGAGRCTARDPSCGGCPLRRSCSWARAGFASPDPATITAGTSRPQAPFKGSDRESRGRLLALLRSGSVDADALKALSRELGLERVRRSVDSLIADGLARRLGEDLVLAE